VEVEVEVEVEVVEVGGGKRSRTSVCGGCRRYSDCPIHPAACAPFVRPSNHLPHLQLRGQTDAIDRQISKPDSTSLRFALLDASCYPLYSRVCRVECISICADAAMTGACGAYLHGTRCPRPHRGCWLSERDAPTAASTCVSKHVCVYNNVCRYVAAEEATAAPTVHTSTYDAPPCPSRPVRHEASARPMYVSMHVSGCPTPLMPHTSFCFVLFCPVLSCFVLLRPVLSCFVLFCPVLSCFVLLRPVLSCFVLFCPVLSCFVLFCPVLSCFVLFCPVLSCFVLFCPASSCFVLFCPASSCFVFAVRPTHCCLPTGCQRKKQENEPFLHRSPEPESADHQAPMSSSN